MAEFAAAAIAAAPADLKVQDVVARFPGVEILPWRQCLRTYGCWVDGELCMWSGPLEHLPDPEPGWRLVLNPADVEQLAQGLAV